MVVARDISAAQPDFDPNAPVATWLYHERVWQQWEVPQWRLFSLVFHTDQSEQRCSTLGLKTLILCGLYAHRIASDGMSSGRLKSLSRACALRNTRPQA
jgi:hypothetical protein